MKIPIGYRIALTAITLLLTSPLLAQPSGNAAENATRAGALASEGIAALRTGDTVSAHRKLIVASESWPTQSAYLWRRAQLAAAAHDTADAVLALTRFAALGMTRSMAQDRFLNNIATDPRLHHVALALARNAAPLVQSTARATLSDSTIWPEGVTYDAPAAGFPVYDGDITIDPTTRATTARWSIAFVRTPGVDSITLLLNSGLTVRRVNGADVLRFSSHRGDEFSQVVVHLTAARDSRTARIDIAYDGVLQLSSDSINIVTPDWVELSVDNFWHPVFADLAQQIVGHARVLLPRGYRGVASGTAVMRGDTLEVTNTVPLVEFAFAASPRLATTEMGKARAYYVGPPPARVAALLDVVNACANDLNAQFGSRTPLRQIDLLLPPRGGPGYARRHYIAISRGANTTPTRMAWFICHELAHNWSQGAVVTGPENWLNEGFAEYASGRSVRRIFGDSAYSTVREFWRQRAAGQPPVWSPTATARPGERVSYAKAPLLLDSLERRVGIPTMDRMLIRFMTEPLRTTPAVLGMFAEVAGPEAAAWFRQALGR